MIPQEVLKFSTPFHYKIYVSESNILTAFLSYFKGTPSQNYSSCLI